MRFVVRLVFRLLRWVIWLVIMVAAIPVLGLAYGFATAPALQTGPLPGAVTGPPALHAEAASAIADYQRPEVSTFLTYPEWAIVYAAREYAAQLKTGRESAFPYFTYAGRFWQDYAVMIRASDSYPFNFNNHLMLVVIGTSHTIEHVLQGVYENTVGRVTEALSGAPVAEDAFQAAAAAEYAAFLDQTPWYRFPYAEKGAALAAIAPGSGMASIRSQERKLAFGLAYWIKAKYAGLITQGLAATSDAAFLDIAVWVKGPSPALAGEPTAKIIRDFGADGLVFVTPRYQLFTDMVPRLIASGFRFTEIGGNGAIMATVLSASPPVMPEGARLLFSYSLPVDENLWRTCILLPVPALHTILPALAAGGARLEHLYDY